MACNINELSPDHGVDLAAHSVVRQAVAFDSVLLRALARLAATAALIAASVTRHSLSASETSMGMACWWPRAARHCERIAVPAA